MEIKTEKIKTRLKIFFYTGHDELTISLIKFWILFTHRIKFNEPLLHRPVRLCRNDRRDSVLLCKVLWPDSAYLLGWLVLKKFQLHDFAQFLSYKKNCQMPIKTKISYITINVKYRITEISKCKLRYLLFRRNRLSGFRFARERVFVFRFFFVRLFCLFRRCQATQKLFRRRPG